MSFRQSSNMCRQRIPMLGTNWMITVLRTRQRRASWKWRKINGLSNNRPIIPSCWILILIHLWPPIDQLQGHLFRPGYWLNWYKKWSAWTCKCSTMVQGLCMIQSTIEQALAVSRSLHYIGQRIPWAMVLMRSLEVTIYDAIVGLGHRQRIQGITCNLLIITLPTGLQTTEKVNVSVVKMTAILTSRWSKAPIGKLKYLVTWGQESRNGIGMNRYIVIKNTHPATTPVASGLFKRLF